MISNIFRQEALQYKKSMDAGSIENRRPCPGIILRQSEQPALLLSNAARNQGRDQWVGEPSGARPTAGPLSFAQYTIDSGHPTRVSSCVYGSRESERITIASGCRSILPSGARR